MGKPLPTGELTVLRTSHRPSAHQLNSAAASPGRTWSDDGAVIEEDGSQHPDPHNPLEGNVSEVTHPEIVLLIAGLAPPLGRPRHREPNAELLGAGTSGIRRHPPRRQNPSLPAPTRRSQRRPGSPPRATRGSRPAAPAPDPPDATQTVWLSPPHLPERDVHVAEQRHALHLVDSEEGTYDCTSGTHGAVTSWKCVSASPPAATTTGGTGVGAASPRKWTRAA
jgi:hypothetical protein